MPKPEATAAPAAPDTATPPAEAARLLRRGRYAAAEAFLRTALARHPDDAALHNLLGLALKNTGRAPEALAAFATAARLAPDADAPLVNRANLHLTRHDGAAAAETLAPLLRRAPGNAEYQRMMGAAQRHLAAPDPGAPDPGAIDRALYHYTQARTLAPAVARHWTEPAAMLEQAARVPEALALLARAQQAHPGNAALAQARLAALRRNGHHQAALACAEALAACPPDAAWKQAELARCLMPADRGRANAHLRAALAREPDNPDRIMELADSLDRTRGPDEGENIDAAWRLARRRVELGGDLTKDSQVLRNILHRACDFATAARLGSFEQLGARWTAQGRVAALHAHMAQVRTPHQRRLLVEYHRAWGRTVDAVAARTPLAMPAVRTGPAKLRLGLMSSDLRNHPVSYFALPLIEGYDRDRFELYCYSWSTAPVDAVQRHIATRVDGFRHAPAIADRDAARLIADDRLDMLFELGGTTYMNKLPVMAWRPAKLQASWLGYPHSAGPGSIDHILVDPYIRPEDPALLIERPLQLARSWVVLGRLGFNDRTAITPGLPSVRAGHVTFGTMNNPYKYTPESLALWARITQAVDGAHFLFVRPEGATEAFRGNIRSIFRQHGVTPDRVEFEAVRGTHMAHYNRIDIALDTFPQTGGTTTCEALWMGVPTVTLVGEAFYERLSHSNLTNAGLPGLSTFSPAAYLRRAVELAADTDTRSLWRHGMRARIRRNPLGRPDWFVEDFQSAVQRAMEAAR